MKKTIYIVLILLMAACQKFNPGDCFKNSGPVSEETREVSSFVYLHMNNNVDVYLTYAPDYSVTVRAGENVIPGIKTSVSGKTLTISNENTCNWVRSYEKPIEVHISAPRLDSIIYQASGNLISTNQFVADSITLDVLEGAGSINLWVNMVQSTYNLHYGTVDLTVRGNSHISYLYSGGYGPADMSGLTTVFTFMTSNSTNNCYVMAGLQLDVKINNVGDVYYSGNPPGVNLEGTGAGKLYKQ
ncbi:MAG: DUF2807 domain-containing protein [Bacteroidales bacterium]|nr:DUF2807 domain-containing protein [Bacteroidales bacterium]